MHQVIEASHHPSLTLKAEGLIWRIVQSLSRASVTHGLALGLELVKARTYAVITTLRNNKVYITLTTIIPIRPPNGIH